MAQMRGLAEGHGRYLDFLAPGILAQSVLFAAIFYGISAIWERDLGVLHRYLVIPAPRSALVLGKAVSSAARGISQAFVVYLLAVALGINVNLNPVALLGVAALIALGSAPALDLFTYRPMHRKDSEAVHGHRPSLDDADIGHDTHFLSRLSADSAAARHCWGSSGRRESAILRIANPQ
jgi:hypothetical protein